MGDGFFAERIGPAAAACVLPLHVLVAVDRLATIKAIGLVGGLGILGAPFGGWAEY